MNPTDPSLARILDAIDRALDATKNAIALGLPTQGINEPGFRSPTSTEGLKRRRKHLRMTPSGHWEEV